MVLGNQIYQSTHDNFLFLGCHPNLATDCGKYTSPRAFIMAHKQFAKQQVYLNTAMLAAQLQR